MKYLLLVTAAALVSCTTTTAQVEQRSLAKEVTTSTKYMTVDSKRMERGQQMGAEEPRVRAMDQESGVYLKLFKLEGKLRGVDVDYTTIRVFIANRFPWPESPRDRGTIGVCWFLGDRRIIIIRQAYWDQADAAAREMLMFHELAHCALNLPHDMSTNEFGYPTSLMFPSAFPSTLYYNRRSEYLDQLFEAAKKRSHHTDIFERLHRHPKSLFIHPDLFEQVKDKPREFFQSR